MHNYESARFNSPCQNLSIKEEMPCKLLKWELKLFCTVLNQGGKARAMFLKIAWRESVNLNKRPYRGAEFGLLA